MLRFTNFAAFLFLILILYCVNNEKTYDKMNIIDDFVKMINNIDKKSFNEKDLMKWCNPIVIKKKKLKVNYRYNVKEFLDETRLS